jgi:Flp pilus assembly protein TadG
MPKTQSRERGFTLVASATCGIVLFGMAGLAVDLGRIYITKNEAQTYADAAALAAAMKLDGSATSLTKGDAAVAAQVNQWNFGTTAFTGTATEYSADGSSGWATSASAVPANMRYARVSASVNNVKLFFMPVTGTGNEATVKASAIAGQVVYGLSASNPVRNSVFPYSPIANIDTTTVVTPVSGTDPYGFVRGQQYDLKWPHSASVGSLGANKVPCQGDNTAAQITRSNGGDEWGEIVLTSASAIRTQIVDDAGGLSVVLGQSVNPKSGQKNTIVDAFIVRSAQDTNDSTTCAYNDSVATCAAALDTYLAGTHNGRRLITVIVNNGQSNAAGVKYASSQQYIGIGFATFWLLPSYDKSGGSNNPWCAVYVGPSAAPGQPDAPSSTTTSVGATFLRLTQ